MFPKRGRIFLNGSGQNTPRLVYARTIAAALRKELGNSHQANKRIQQWTGARERTIKNWLNGASGPRGEHLLMLAYHSDSVFEAVLALSEREQAISGAKLRRICDEMAASLQSVRTLMRD